MAKNLKQWYSKHQVTHRTESLVLFPDTTSGKDKEKIRQEDDQKIDNIAEKTESVKPSRKELYEASYV